MGGRQQRARPADTLVRPGELAAADRGPQGRGSADVSAFVSPAECEMHPSVTEETPRPSCLGGRGLVLSSVLPKRGWTGVAGSLWGSASEVCTPSLCSGPCGCGTQAHAQETQAELQGGSGTNTMRSGTSTCWSECLGSLGLPAHPGAPPQAPCWPHARASPARWPCSWCPEGRPLAWLMLVLFLHCSPLVVFPTASSSLPSF